MARETSSASQTARTDHPEVAERCEQADRSDEKNHCGWSAGDHVAGLLPDDHSASVIGRCQRDKSGAEVANQHEPYDPGRRRDGDMLHMVTCFISKASPSPWMYTRGQARPA